MNSNEKDQKEIIKEQKELIKKQKLIRKNLISLFMIIRNKELLQRITKYSFNLFEFSYIYQTIYYKNEKEDFVTDMKIGYFDVNSIIDDSFKTKCSVFNNFINQLIFKLFKEKLNIKQTEFDKILKTKLVGKSTFWWINKFSFLISFGISKKIFTFYKHILKTFDETFEKNGNNKGFILKDENFIFNEEKLKLFKEYKISSAERYLKNSMISFTKEILKKTIKEFKEKTDFNKLDN